LGDFDGNDVLDIADSELLAIVIRNSFGFGDQARVDLDQNDVIDDVYFRTWAKDLKHTWYGDANLDGQFNSADLVNLFQAGEYEDSISRNSTWSTGDFNGDGDFTTPDLVVAFQDGGYEQGPRPGVVTVPEPAGQLLVLWVACVFRGIRRRTRAGASFIAIPSAVRYHAVSGASG
jgi:hypothetical protein